jgi:hypothetical protein
MAAAPWDFSSAKPSSLEVEKPLGYHRGAQQQQVQEARAGKASIEEVNKERALKQRVSNRNHNVMNPPPFPNSPASSASSSCLLR